MLLQAEMAAEMMLFVGFIGMLLYFVVWIAGNCFATWLEIRRMRMIKEPVSISLIKFAIFTSLILVGILFVIVAFILAPVKE